MENAEYYSVCTAAERIGLKSICHARRLLGDPDAKVSTSKKRDRFLYTPEHVQNTKIRWEEKKKEKHETKGKRGCYHCRRKFLPFELKSGICAACQARKCVLNFSCCGDCTKCPPDIKRLALLKEATRELESKIERYYK